MQRLEVSGAVRLIYGSLGVKRLKLYVQYHHTYRCDDTRDCIVQFWPPDDEYMCSKHVEASNKLIIKFSASSRLIL